jgi:dihydrolipoamide dehydrogenase
MNNRYTVVVIGAGPAGHTCAVRLAQLGARVAVVERDYVGGICTNWGCTPSKAMIEAAKIARTVNESAQYGVHVADVQIDFKAIAARRDQVILKSRADVTALLAHHGVDIYRGEAYCVSPGVVRIRSGKLDLDGYEMHYTGAEETIEADHVVLATGSQPLLPGFVDPENEFVVSSNRLISIGELPGRLAIVGGGVIGLEFATIFANLGSQVTVIEYLDRVLATLDPEISSAITREMEAVGVRVLAGHEVKAIEQGEVRATQRASGENISVSADAVLIAVGRKPVIEERMFEQLGIAHSPKGIEVDAYLRTTAPNVWAIGDATGKSILAHVGMQQGIVCAENIMGAGGQPGRAMDYDVIPAVVYTIPEVVSVGRVPTDLEGVTVVRVPFAVNLRAKIEGYDSGFLKVWIKAERVLAAQAIGHNVSEIMQELSNMIALKTPIHAVAELIHAHPTYSEIVRSALEYARGQATDFFLEEPVLTAD